LVLPNLDLSSSTPPLDVSISPLSLLRQPLSGTLLAQAGFAVAIFVLAVPALSVVWRRFKGRDVTDSFVSAVVGISCISPIVWTHHLPLAAVALLIESFSSFGNQPLRWIRCTLCLGAYVLMSWGPLLASAIIGPVAAPDLVRLLPNIGLCLILVSSTAFLVLPHSQGDATIPPR